MKSNRRRAAWPLPLQLPVILTVIAMLAFVGGQAIAATIHTDLWIYRNGDTVQVFGEEFGPAETVDIVTTAPSGSTVDTGTADTDEAGAFTYRFVLNSNESGIFDVLATGQTSGLTASTQFDPAHASLSPGSKAYGNVNVGSTSSQTFTISNTGTSNLNIQTVVLSGSDPGDFILDTSGMASSVAAGGSTTFSVTFAPGNAGAKSASVDVTTNAEDPSAALTGTGVSSNTAPTISDVTNQTINEDSNTGALAVTVGDAETPVGSLTMSGSSSDTTLVPNGNIVFGGSGANRTVTVTPAANQSGTSTITLTVTDAGSLTASDTFVLTVTAVNDVPSFTKGSNQTVAQGAGAQTVAGWATAISAGPADESGQSLTFQVSNDNNGLFSVQPAVASNGTLTYTPTAAGTATVTVNLKDNGGTANGGVDTSADQTLTITVTASNTAPTISDVTNQTVNEDADTGALAVTVGDAETPVGSLTMSGSSSNTTLVPNGNIVFGGSGASRTVTVTPAADQNGTATITLTVTDGGSMTASDTFVLTVTAVNDVPSFTKGADETVSEDAGTQSVAGWATAISAGPADESGQTPTFQVSNDNNGLFSAQPAVASGGTLTFTPAANASGSATVTLSLKDNGGTANGGVDTSADQTFTITVTAVNDAPTISDVTNQTINEDASTGALAFTVGDAETAPGSLSMSGSSSNTTLVPNANITFGGSGASRTVTVTPAVNQNGTATITLTVTDGGSMTASDTFVLTVTAVNDVPSFTKGANQTVAEDAGAQTVAGWATAISAGPADESSQTLTFQVSNDDNGIFSAQPAVTSGGTLTFTPTAAGSATVTVNLKDNGGTSNGGVDTSADQTFTITVTAVNDAPTCADVSITTNEDTLGSTAPDCSDAEGDPLTYTVTAASDGTSGVALGQLGYDPDPNFNGTDGFTYTANDGTSDSNEANVDVTVDAVNDAPVAVDDTATTNQDTALTGIDVLGNDTDAEDDTLSISAFDDPSVEGGAVSCASDCSYTPPSSFSGTDSFTYTVDDGDGGTDTATVTIMVDPTNSPSRNHRPRISVTPASQTVQYSDAIKRITIVGSDAETPGSGLAFSATGMPQGVTLVNDGNGKAYLKGTADDALSTYSISVTVRDADGARASATATITIVPENTWIRYTGDHLVFTEPGASSADVRLSATITDGSSGAPARAVALFGAAAPGDVTAGDVSSSTVTFMEGDKVLCGPVPVTLVDASDPTVGTAACDGLVTLPVGSHDIDVHVDGSYSYTRRVGQVEIDKVTRNFVAGGGFLSVWSSAGDHAGDAGSRASFCFRVRYNPHRTNVRGHVNLLFVSGGSTYQVRGREIGSIETGPGDGTASFVAHGAFADVTDPLDPVSLGSNLRVVVHMTDGGETGDRISIAVYRGSTLVFASAWDGQPVKKTLGGGGILVH